jgi:hypothetical protein
MNELNQSNSSARAKLIKKIEIIMGGQLIDVDLDKISLDLAVDLALDTYRQKAENALEESYVFFSLTEQQNEIILPNEVQDVRKVYRRSFGSIGGENQAGQLDPFDIAFTNMYLLQNNTMGGLATFDFYAQNIELAGRLFGLDLNFSFNQMTKKLKIVRNFRRDGEEVVAWVYNHIPDEKLINDMYAGPWLRKYAVAEAKMMLGTAYSKFATYGGPQGGITLNGSELKSEAMQEKLELEESLKKYGDGSRPLGIVIG